MFWPFRTRHLPLPEGPYVPGCCDVMTEYSPEGCYMRFYYPTSLSDAKKYSSSWVPWLPDNLYLNAFAYVLNMWSWLLRAVFKLFAGNAQIPAVWEAELRKQGGKFPVIVFSHGLGASRFFYSCICLELASRGFFVAAVEHRERSACTSFYYATPEERKLKKPTRIKFQKVPLGENHLPTRQTQVRKRAAECQKALDLLEVLNEGKPVDNVLDGKFHLSQLKGRLDFSRLVMMGHSFGGATSIRTLANDSRFKVGVILDAWMFPVKDDSDLTLNINQPLLFVNTKTFQIAPNVSVMERFMDDEAAKKTERSGYTIRHTTHEHQADSTLLVGSWLNMFMKKLDPLTAMKINNHLILSYLHRHVGIPAGPLSEKFLQSQDANIARTLLIA